MIPNSLVDPISELIGLIVDVMIENGIRGGFEDVFELPDVLDDGAVVEPETAIAGFDRGLPFWGTVVVSGWDRKGHRDLLFRFSLLALGCQLVFGGVAGVGFGPMPEIVENIHVIDKGIIRSLVGVEVFMDVAVIEPFGAHIIEVVTGLEVAPVGN